jgi:MFS family permease
MRAAEGMADREERRWDLLISVVILGLFFIGMGCLSFALSRDHPLREWNLDEIPQAFAFAGLGIGLFILSALAFRFAASALTKDYAPFWKSLVLSAITTLILYVSAAVASLFGILIGTALLGAVGKVLYGVSFWRGLGIVVGGMAAALGLAMVVAELLV